MYPYTAFEAVIHETSVTLNTSVEKEVWHLSFVVLNMLYTCIINNRIGKSEDICFRQMHVFALDCHNYFNLFRFEVWTYTEDLLLKTWQVMQDLILD